MHTLKLVLWLLILLIVAGLMVLFYPFIFAGRGSSAPVGGTSQNFQNLVIARSTGDYAGALTDYQSVVNDPTSTADEKANAIIAVSGAAFHLSGNIGDRLQDVQNLKQVVLDTTVSAGVRAQALDALASTYGDSGSDPAVFAEIFKDAPFSGDLVPGNASLSIRKLYELSYRTVPTPEAAVHIAKWYADQLDYKTDLSASTTASYIASAEDSLNNAQAAALAQGSSSPSYINSSRYYVQYQFWRAVVVGRLAQQKVAPYTTEYQNEFDQYISYAEQPQNVSAKENLYYARYYYAETLNDLGSSQAKLELDTLAQELQALPNPNTTGFVRFIRNTYAAKGPNWLIMESLFPLSSSFENTAKGFIPSS